MQVPVVNAEKVFTTDTVIEAEHTIVNNGVMHFDSEEASNGYAVYSGSYKLENAAKIKTEDINFKFFVETAGKYHIYLRCNFPNSTGGYFYRIDKGDWVYKFDTTDGFEWKEMGYVELSAGNHRFSWNHSAKNGDIDAFFITMDESKLPTFSQDAEVEEPTSNEIKNVINKQTKEFVVTGNGTLFEAEDATYSDFFTKVSSKMASGGTALKAVQEDRGGGGVDKRGQLELEFTVDKDGTYIAYIRTLALSGASDSCYSSFSGQAYDYIGFEDEELYGEYSWTKAATMQIKAGEKKILRLIPRERNAQYDAIIITPTAHVPTGRTGDIPEGEVKAELKSKHPPTPVKPPAEHPRVLFTKDDIPRIKANLEKGENALGYNVFQRYISEPIDSSMIKSYDTVFLAKIEAHAFNYAINGVRESGKMAVDTMIAFLDTANVTGNYTRNGGHMMYVASEVYSWCYDLLTTAQKLKIISLCEAIAHKTEIKWPPENQGSLAGHGAEAQLLRDMLSFAIATYNERPDIWEAVGGRFYSEYVPGREFFITSGFAQQGDSYGLYRHRWDSWAYWLIRGMGAEEPYDGSLLGQMGYGHLYLRRPDGQQLRDGDTSNDTSYLMWENWSSYAETYMMDGAMTGDPYIKDEFFALNSTLGSYFEDSPIMFLIINNPEVKSASIENLPKSRYFGFPAAMMVARTGWDKGAASDDVVAEMKIGGVNMNGHQHLDAGHFQIYYKGILASDSGVYQGLKNDTSVGGTTYGSDHYYGYMVKSIAHNTMLINDPSESDGTGGRWDVNDGGQRIVASRSEPWEITDVTEDLEEYEVSKTVGKEIDPENPVDPYYTYVKGDLTNAYSSKVKDFKRSFMFLNLFDDEVPAALIVFDKVTSANPSFKKTWLLHGVEEPTVNGMQTVFARTYQSPVTPNGYNGKMTVDTLLPAENDAVIDVIGGEEEGYSNVNGIDYTGLPSANHVDEGNTYRMELSPKTSKTTDYFLNVIQVSDNDKSYYIKPQMLENVDFYGVQIKDRAVFFSKSGERVSKDISLSVEGKTRVTVCDAKAGNWTLSSGGSERTVYASEDGGVLSFEASGAFTLHYQGEGEAPEKKEVVLGTENVLRLRINWQLVHCPEGPEFSNNKAMAPLSTLAAWYGFTANETDTDIVLSKKDLSATISIGSPMLISGENTIDMGAAVYKKNNEIMVPIREVVELFGGTVAWRQYSRIVDLDLPPADYSLPEGYALFKSIEHDDGEVDGGNIAANAGDGDGDTIWAALGIGRYIDIELDKVYKLDRTEILFNPNGGRNAAFEIQISEDGVTYETVIESSSDGSLEAVAWEYYDFEKPVETKYIRYVANGSNISNWNAIKEIRFREMK